MDFSIKFTTDSMRKINKILSTLFFESKFCRYKNFRGEYHNKIGGHFDKYDIIKIPNFKIKIKNELFSIERNLRIGEDYFLTSTTNKNWFETIEDLVEFLEKRLKKFLIEMHNDKKFGDNLECKISIKFKANEFRKAKYREICYGGDEEENYYDEELYYTSSEEEEN